jgi:membrane protease subunit HflK
MDSNREINETAFDRSGRYEAGLKSLVKCLRWAFALLLVGIIGTLVYFVSWGGYFSVEPQQAVLVLRFGKIIQTFTTGGHWFLPYPVNKFVRIQTNQQLLNVDFVAPTLTANEAPNALTPGKDSYLITGDANIVHTSWTVSYRVSNPAKYYTTLGTPADPVINGRISGDPEFKDADGFIGTRGPVTFLRNTFQQAVIEATAEFKVDDLLAAGQGRYAELVQRLFTRLLTAADCGITVDTVTLNRVYPPAFTKAAFDQVTAASTTQSTLRNEAETYRVNTENETLAKQAEIIAAAETYRKQTVAVIKAETTYFKSINKEYLANSDTVLMALYTSALTEAFQSPVEDKFILGTDGKGTRKVWFQLNRENKVKAPQAEEKK